MLALGDDTLRGTLCLTCACDNPLWVLLISNSSLRMVIQEPRLPEFVALVSQGYLIFKYLTKSWGKDREYGEPNPLPEHLEKQQPFLPLTPIGGN